MADCPHVTPLSFLKPTVITETHQHRMLLKKPPAPDSHWGQVGKKKSLEDSSSYFM